MVIDKADNRLRPKDWQIVIVFPTFGGRRSSQMVVQEEIKKDYEKYYITIRAI